MKVFITGATGNAGAEVLDLLVSRGHQVWALSRRPHCQAGVHFLTGGLRDLGRWRAQIRACDAILHLASTRSHQLKEVIRDDILGTRRLLSFWTQGRFVYASSQVVYGRPQGILSEDHPLAPETLYDLGNVLCERLVAARAAALGAVGVSLRLGLVIGAGARRRDRQFLPPVFDAALSGGTFLFSSHEALSLHGSSFLGPSDFARAVVACAERGKPGAFNLSSGFTTWRALLETISRTTGQEVPLCVAPERPATLPPSRSYLTSSKLERALGFSPRDSRDSLESLVDAFWLAEGIQRNG